MNTRENCDEAEQDGVGSGPGAGDAARSPRKVVRGRQVLGGMRRGKEKKAGVTMSGAKMDWCHTERMRRKRIVATLGGEKKKKRNGAA